MATSPSAKPPRSGRKKKKKEQMRSKSPGAISVRSSGYGALSGKPPEKKFRTEEELIDHLQIQVERYGKKAKAGKEEIKELDRVIEKLSRDIIQYRHSMGGVLALRDNDYYVGVNQSIMEKRIVNGGVKYMDQIGENNNVRQKIDDMRREFLILRKVSAKLESEKASQMKESERLGKKIAAAKSKIAKAQEESRSIKLMFDEKVSWYGERWTELQQEIKSKKRSKAEMEKGRQSEEAIKKRESRRRELLSRWESAYMNALEQHEMEPAESIEEAFLQVLNTADVADHDAFVSRYENIVETINDAFEATADFREKCSSAQADIEELGSYIKANEVNDAAAQENIFVNAVKELCEALSIPTDEDEACDYSLGGIGEANLMAYLGLVEQRVDELRGLESPPPPEDDGECMVSMIGEAFSADEQENEGEDAGLSILPPSSLQESSGRAALSPGSSVAEPLTGRELHDVGCADAQG